MRRPTHARGRASALSCSRTASSTTPIRPMRGAWTVSGACISGSIAPPGAATSRTSGGVVMTSTASAEAPMLVATSRGWSAPRMAHRPAVQDRPFLGLSALLFAASSALTGLWCASMSRMDEMPMAGGWTMSMAWMRMPGQSWPGAAGSFLGMWVVMMVAMMLPALVPMLWRYRQALAGTDAPRLDRLTAVVGLAYFFVWTVFGAVAYPL